MTKPAQLVIDPEFAALIPKLRPDELAGLEESLLAEGCRDALVVWRHDGKLTLLDGHNRKELSDKHGISYKFVEIELESHDEARLWILRNQASRRNLSDDQRAIILDEIIEQQSIVVRARQLAAARSAKAAKASGVPVLNTSFKTEKAPIDTRSELSAQHGVAKRKAQYARLLRKADPAAAQSVKAGTTLLADAVRAVKKRQMVEQLESVSALQAKEIAGVFDCVVIDPPWPTDKIARACRPMDVQFAYPVMALDEIASLVGGMLEKHAEQNCHVFLWTTNRFLPDAIDLLKQWALRYCLTFTWVKSNGGMKPFDLPTHNSEFVVYGRRGTPTFIDTRGFYAAFEAPRTKHSEKPEKFYAMLRKAVAGRRLDLFGRRPHEGFISWGKEASPLDAKAATN